VWAGTAPAGLPFALLIICSSGCLGPVAKKESRLISASGAPAVRRIDLALILLVTLAWGLNYPLMKSVVAGYPPMTFRGLTFLLALIVIGGYGLYRRDRFRIPAGERAKVFQIGLFNMLFWHLGLILSLTLLNSGRAAIVGYSMPIWALLTSILIYKQKMTLRAGIGIVLALCATYLLTIDEIGKLTGQPLGMALILTAAICWGIGNAMVKHSTLTISNVVLSFWSLTLACVICLALGAAFELPQWRMPNLFEWLGIIYNGVIALALGYVAWFTVARRLSAVTSGLSIMLVPMVAVIGGAIWLSEAITKTDLFALMFILAAMATVMLPARAGGLRPAAETASRARRS
jgi:drug/metabolite transporter (DMT)-like permease